MNPSIFTLVVVPLFLSAILSYLLAPLSIVFAKKFGIIDDPLKNKHPKVIHTVPTPRGGGLGIFLTIAFLAMILLPLDKYLLAILLGALLLLIMGILDDKYNLNPYLRLSIQFLAACIPIAVGIGIAFISNPFNGLIDLSIPKLAIEFLGETRNIWIVADIFALIWIVTLINFLNMGAKGIPGQLPGVVGIAALIIAILSLRFSADITEWPVTILASLVAGAYFGFLPWNTFPQRIMPSFAGSNVGGFLLGVLAILTTTKVGTLILVLAIPLIDTGYTILRRLAAGKSPVWGDRGHLHHKLLDMGMSQHGVAILYWGATLLLGLLALNLAPLGKAYTIIGVGVVLGGFLLFLSYRKKV